MIILLQLLCEHNPVVNPDDVHKLILKTLLQNESRNWRYSEFIITGLWKDLLSSKNWFWNDSLHRAINNSESVNFGYSQHTNFREFFRACLQDKEWLPWRSNLSRTQSFFCAL